MATCSNPGCDQPGTSKCSACNSTLYCGSKCQTADWPHHKEECPGHLRKVGMANFVKAQGYGRERNWPQTLRCSDLAATKLKQLKDRPVEDIDDALKMKWDALSLMGRYREALECAKERYCLYLTSHTHPPAIEASFSLIQSCMFNKEFFDAALYARTLWETLTLSGDSHIPEHQQQPFTARGAMELAQALWQLAEHGGMPAEEKQEAGQEAIMLARRALEITTQVHGAESCEVAGNKLVLTSVLNYFNDFDDEEVPRLLEQAKAVFARVHGTLTSEVAATENNLGTMYDGRATRAFTAHDLDRCIANLELALPRFREATRIYRAIDLVDDAGDTARFAASVEGKLRQVVALRGTTATT